jgi:hypothetical protein
MPHMLDKILKVKDKVMSVLRDFPQTRESDKLVWLAYMCQYHGLKDQMGKESYMRFKQWFLQDTVPCHESIRRVRAQIQSSGLFRGENYKERRAQAKEVYHHFGDGSGGDGSGKLRNGERSL